MMALPAQASADIANQAQAAMGTKHVVLGDREKGNDQMSVLVRRVATQPFTLDRSTS
jgi:hypothetical protein